MKGEHRMKKKGVVIGVGVFALIITIGALLPSDPEPVAEAEPAPRVYECPTGDTLAHEYCVLPFGERIREGAGPDVLDLTDVPDDVLAGAGYENMTSSGGRHRVSFTDDSYILTRWTRDGSDARGGRGQFAGFVHVGRDE